jgi:hypothetical protein
MERFLVLRHMDRGKPTDDFDIDELWKGRHVVERWWRYGDNQFVHIKVGAVERLQSYVRTCMPGHREDEIWRLDHRAILVRLHSPL